MCLFPLLSCSLSHRNKDTTELSGKYTHLEKHLFKKNFFSVRRPVWSPFYSLREYDVLRAPALPWGSKLAQKETQHKGERSTGGVGCISATPTGISTSFFSFFGGGVLWVCWFKRLRFAICTERRVLAEVCIPKLAVYWRTVVIRLL